NQDNSPRIHINAGYEHQRLGNVAGARETVGSIVVQKSGIQCYNCKEYGYVARECQKPKRAKDAAYHREKMLLYAHNMIIESEDMNDDSEQIDQNDEDADLAEEQMKTKLSAHQDTISILKQQKDAQIKLYKSREDKEIEKVIDLENKVNVLDKIVYKTSQSVQTMNMLNNKCRTSFAKLEYLKKAKQANPRLYDI
nr:hypothetical protein [Tanacetum cinerariifolium]